MPVAVTTEKERPMITTNPHYARIGGEEKIRELVARFYQLMDSLPEAKTIRAMHARDLRGSKEKLFMFLSGWLGGPELYVEKYGHPRLRQRHLPFAIDSAARDQWMHCMQQAMTDVGIDERLREELLAAFAKTADFMRNQPE
jgi:hemoglobin